MAGHRTTSHQVGRVGDGGGGCWEEELPWGCWQGQGACAGLCPCLAGLLSKLSCT